MIAEQQTIAPTTPFNFDAPCRGCGYNLRGLSGELIRCPECGREHSRTELELLYGLRVRFAELKGAGDAMLLGIIALVAGAYLLLTSGPFPVGIPMLGGAAVLIYLAMSSCGRVMPAESDWHSPLLHYVGWTCLLGLVPFGIWAIFSLLVWRMTTAFPSIRTGATIDAVHVLAAAAPTAIVLYFIRPTRRIRWRQRRAFGRLVRMLKGR